MTVPRRVRMASVGRMWSVWSEPGGGIPSAGMSRLERRLALGGRGCGLGSAARAGGRVGAPATSSTF